MADEQLERFDSIRVLVERAASSVEDLREMADEELTEVTSDSSRQAEYLQRIQQSAGTAVQALTEVADLARHARSFQAQAHSHRNDDKPH